MAGLLGTAMAGALAGAGKAVQYNSQSSIEQKRQAALKQIDHDYAMVRQEDQQTFTAEQGELKHERGMEQERYRQEQANQRAMTRAQTPTASIREAEYLVNNGVAPDINAAYSMVSSRAGQGQDQLDYLQERIGGVRDFQASDQWLDLSPEQQETYQNELNQLEERRRRLESRAYQNGNGGGLLGGTGGQSSTTGTQGGAPTIDDILNSVLR